MSATRWLGPYKNADDALNELRKSVAELIGADPDTWPDNGNAPLAIAATLALARRAPVVVPDGWALVPVKVTEEMKARVRKNGSVQALAFALAAWPDFLAAAPVPPVVPDVRGLLRKAVSALDYFADAVFNDNGDMTVTGMPFDPEKHIEAYQVRRRLTVALASLPTETGGEDIVSELQRMAPMVGATFTPDPEKLARYERFQAGRAGWILMNDDGKRWRICGPAGRWVMKPEGAITADEARAICETAMGGLAAPTAEAQGETLKCFICREPILKGQMVLPDINEGLGHRECFGNDRDGFCNLETGEPLGPDDPLPAGEPYEPDEVFASLPVAPDVRVKPLEWEAAPPELQTTRFIAKSEVGTYYVREDAWRPEGCVWLAANGIEAAKAAAQADCNERRISLASTTEVFRRRAEAPVKGKHKKPDDPYIQCHGCGRWLYSSEAQWADDGEPFCTRHQLDGGPLTSGES
ncbi:hypothetical protein [Xanthobacter aminoxidans]|uniref:hypothetical protein n=1 Tax=Xanthobacter aminoxidans TaxID=186280 RepID=UPI002022D0C2|nr:hypothetical protein [Xanthobacter aminoxidans]MCL8385811.1 hypothetical protein [Xanthobacter aminoxidans]